MALADAGQLFDKFKVGGRDPARLAGILLRARARPRWCSAFNNCGHTLSDVYVDPQVAYAKGDLPGADALLGQLKVRAPAVGAEGVACGEIRAIGPRSGRGRANPTSC